MGARALALLDKDARLGLAEATALNVPMWTLEQASRVWRFAMTQGYADQDVIAIARHGVLGGRRDTPSD